MLTARELVDELRLRRVGTWKPDAVRQWTRQTPPCPIARRADADGLPHLFDLRDVLAWLAERNGESRRGAGRRACAAVANARRALAEFDATGPQRLYYLARSCLIQVHSRLNR